MGFMPGNGNWGPQLFKVSVCDSVTKRPSMQLLNQKRERLHIRHTYPRYSTNETLSSDTKVNDLVTLTLTFILKMTVLDFVAVGVLQTLKHLAFSLERLS